MVHLRLHKSTSRTAGRDLGRIRCRASWAAFVTFLLTASSQFVVAQDVIHFRTSERPGAYGTISGEIVGYNGRILRVRISGGRVTRIDGDRVQRIETRRTAEQLSGDRLLEQRAIREALSQYRAALESERRAWVRREILAQAVRCYRELGDRRSAAESFLRLYQSDPTTEQFASIPLAWVPEEPSRAMARAGTPGWP